MRAIALLGWCAAAGPLAAQSRHWTDRERVIVTDFRDVRALSASESRLYVASTRGLGLYDHRFRRWEAPVTNAEGYPREPVFAALADPADEAVWLGTASGAVRYRPLSRQFDVVLVPGGVRDFLYDRADPFRGIYLRTSTGWEFLPRGAFAPMREPLPPAGRRAGTLAIETLMNRQPIVDARRAAVLMDDRLRTMRYSAAAAVPNSEQYFLGTDRGGVILFDALMQRFEPMPFGLLSPGAGAVLSVPDGVWVGTDGRGPRAGLTYVGRDLQEFAYEEGPRGTSFGGHSVRALMARDDEIWAATDRGVVRTVPRGDTRRLTAVNGLPDDETYALAQGPSGVWIGTAAGLAFLRTDDDEARRADGPLVPVLALAASRDTVAIGMTVGLGFAAADGDIMIPVGWDSIPELRQPITAVAWAADTLVVATSDRLLWKPPGGAWRVVRTVAPHVGVIYALAPDAGGVWVGGRDGLVRFGFEGSDLRILRVPGDVPGLVRGIVLDQEYLWVATEAGLVRFTRRALSP